MTVVPVANLVTQRARSVFGHLPFCTSEVFDHLSFPGGLGNVRRLGLDQLSRLARTHAMWVLRRNTIQGRHYGRLVCLDGSAWQALHQRHAAIASRTNTCVSKELPQCFSWDHQIISCRVLHLLRPPCKHWIKIFNINYQGSFARTALAENASTSAIDKSIVSTFACQCWTRQISPMPQHASAAPDSKFSRNTAAGGCTTSGSQKG